MTYDPHTHTIRLGDGSDLYADSGAQFLAELRHDAALPIAPKQSVRDWETVASWLRCGGRELNHSDFEVWFNVSSVPCARSSSFTDSQ